MPLSNMGYRPISSYAYDDIYDELIKDKTFSTKSHIWGIGLLLGYILKRRSSNQPTSSVGGFVRIVVTYSQNKKDYPMYLDLLNFVYDHYAEGSNEKEKLKDLDKIAEGGIEYLKEEKEKLGSVPLDIPKIIQKVRELSNEENATEETKTSEEEDSDSAETEQS
ncbi:MAG: hypothetical protein CL763_08635 [Chloroflexi bacterium]|nr:hypothetical protein [Chloroflexota bacterium]|tara:strand:- start:7265 stop:7756 length:492 start_codon:yes stop_codon:yes gene_type:complete